MQDIFRSYLTLGSDQAGCIVHWTETYNVAFKKFEDQNTEDVSLRYMIPLYCVAVQMDTSKVGPNTSWLQDNKPLSQASKVQSPVKR